MEKILTTENFDNAISEGVALVDFFANWCGPCKMLAPTIEELAAEYDGRASICKVDVDENQSLAEKYGIYSIPALLIFKDGELKEKLVGFRAKSQIVESIDKYL